MLETNKNLVLGHLIKTMMIMGDTKYFGFFLIFFWIFHEVCFKKMFPFRLFIVRIKRICMYLYTYKFVLI